jgi:hypothetical protein
LEKNKDKIHWGKISINENAIDLIKERIEYELSLTIEEYNNLPRTIDWDWLCINKNAVNLLKEYPEFIRYDLLCKNENAIDLIKERIEYENTILLDKKINWNWLSENPNAIKLLEKNKEKINIYLSKNPNGVDLLEKNKNKIDWYMLSANPGIFEDEPMPDN